MSFPSSTDSFQGFTSTDTLATDNHAAQHNQEQSAVVAIENKVGLGASTPVSGTILRGNGTGTSAWSQANAATDLTGILPVANGGTGVGTSTGTGSTVLSNSPSLSSPNLTNATGSLSQPTITDFTSANHNHQNVSGGGTLNAASALQAGSVNFTNLLSTIFSDNVTTASNAGTWGGTNWWINLGGIKFLWGSSNNSTTLATASDMSKTVTLPSFFSGIQATMAIAQQSGSFSTQEIATISSVSTTTATIVIHNFGSGTGVAPNINWFIIGN